jgi:hypothetical protein
MANISLQFIYLKGFPANSLAELYSAYGLVNRRVMPNPGSIMGMSLQSESLVRFGQILAMPTIEGIEIGLPDLNLILSPANQKMVHASIPPNSPGFIFNEGQELGIKLSSSLDWDNENSNILATLFVNLTDLSV